MTTYSHLHSLIHPSPDVPSPSVHPLRPTVNTNIRYTSNPASATSSIQANSAMPLLKRADRPDDRNTDSKRSVAGMSTISSEHSAARPDSDIIPFETFMSSRIG
jgi:hypothetical protein